MSRCDWGRHKWTRWSKPIEYNVTMVHKRTLQEYKKTAMIQERTCSLCGIEEKHEVEVNLL
jgi:hypothetical protein